MLINVIIYKFPIFIFPRKKERVHIFESQPFCKLLTRERELSLK